MHATYYMLSTHCSHCPHGGKTNEILLERAKHDLGRRLSDRRKVSFFCQVEKEWRNNDHSHIAQQNTETLQKKKGKKKRAVSTKLPRSKMSEPDRSSHIHSLGTGYLYTFTSSPTPLSSGFSLYAASCTVQPHTEERGRRQPSWMNRVSIISVIERHS